MPKVNMSNSFKMKGGELCPHQACCSLLGHAALKGLRLEWGFSKFRA